MAYTRVNWKNKEDSATTPLNAYNLNIMDKGISDVDKKTEELEREIKEINDATAEVTRARTGADGTEYSNLKSRLDTENEQSASQIEALQEALSGVSSEVEDIEKEVQEISESLVPATTTNLGLIKTDGKTSKTLDDGTLVIIGGGGGGGSSEAIAINYDNTDSGLKAENVQFAIDGLAGTLSENADWLKKDGSMSNVELTTKLNAKDAIVQRNSEKLGDNEVNGFIQNNNLINIETVIQGTINGTDGEWAKSDTEACSLEYIKVKPSTKYTLSCVNSRGTLRFIEYNASKQFTLRSTNDAPSFTITTSANTEYLRWAIGFNDGDVTKERILSSKIQLEEGTRRGTYVEDNGFSNKAITKKLVENEDYLDNKNIININSASITDDKNYLWISLEKPMKARHTYFIRIYDDYSHILRFQGTDAISNGFSTTYTPMNDESTIVLGCREASLEGKGSEMRALKFMIYEGVVDIGYKPYRESNVELTAKLSDVYEDGFASKNMFDVNGYYSVGSNITVSDNSIEFTNSNYTVVRYRKKLKAGKYALSFDLNITSGTSYVGVNGAEYRETTNGRKQYAITISEEKEVEIAFGGASSTSSGTFTNIQLEKGETATSYQAFGKPNDVLTQELEGEYITNYNTIKVKKVGNTIYVHFNGYSVSNNGKTTYFPMNDEIIRLMVYDNTSKSMIRFIINTDKSISLLDMNGQTITSALVYGEYVYYLF